MHEPSSVPGETGAIANKTMETVVALIFLMIAGVVIYDSLRLGILWQPAIGPASGTFPFMMGCGLAIASAMNLLAALGKTTGQSGKFVNRSGLFNVAAVVLPLLAYVALIGFIGVYLSAAILIFGFMVTLGREPVWKAAMVAVAVPIVAFVLFEKAFLVPLPRGPFENMLGL